MPPKAPSGFTAPLIAVTKSLAIDIAQVYLTLLKVMVPALIVVKLLDLAGATAWLAVVLSPLMQLVGLPDTMGLVWAATMLTNIYTGMAVFFQMASDVSLTTAQVSVLGALMLGAHSLPVEGAVARAAGVKWSATLSLRLGGAFALAVLLNAAYTAGGWLQQPVQTLWEPAAEEGGGLLAWVVDQLVLLASVLLVIAVLMTALRLMRAVGIERLMHALLSPLLKLIGIRREAANITVIGMTLGLSFGGGLLIREARSGRINRRDVFLTMALLGFCHSLIEDTLLVLLLGADLSAILWARLGFALVVVAVMARLPMLNRRLRDEPV